MKKSLLVLLMCLCTGGAYAQDDDVYFVPSSKDKTPSTVTGNNSRSSYEPVVNSDELSSDNWAEGRKNDHWDVDSYNRRGKNYRYNSDTLSASADYDEGYADGYEDGSYTARLVRFWSPRPGVYVSSPYYLDYYDLWYDPWFYGYGYSWGWSFSWSGWWGWGSWYGWRPYYSWWGWGWGHWHDPWWGGPAYAWGHGHWRSSGLDYRYGYNRRLYAGAGNRSSRDGSSGRFGTGFAGNRNSRSTSYRSSFDRNAAHGVTSGSRSSRTYRGNTTDNLQRSYDRNNSSRNFDTERSSRSSRSYQPSRSTSTPSRSISSGGGFNRGGFGGGRGGGGGRSYGGRR